MESKEDGEDVDFVHKTGVNPRQLVRQNEICLESAEEEHLREASCVEGNNNNTSNSNVSHGVNRNAAALRTCSASEQQQQATVELSLEGLQSLDQRPVIGDNKQSVAGDETYYGVPTGALEAPDTAPSAVAPPSTLTLASSSPGEREEAHHGASCDGVLEIAPLRLQVSKPKAAAAAAANVTYPYPAIEALMSQGRCPFEVVLKGGGPWGFGLNGGRGTDLPLYISKIKENGKASDSALMEGDYVLQINSLSCAELGEAMDSVDTAFNTLTLLVLRGQWNPPSPGSASTTTNSSSSTNNNNSSSNSNKSSSNLLQRAYDLQLRSKDKDKKSSEHRQRPVSSDDSAVFTASRSNQQQQLGLRHGKRRGESFNVGRLNHSRGSPNSIKYRGADSPSKADRANSYSSPSPSAQKHPLSPSPSHSPVWSPNEPRRSSSSALTGVPAASLDLDPGHGRHFRPGSERRSEQWGASRDDMNRRRSEGYGLGGGAPRYAGQDRKAQPSQYQQQQQQHHSQQHPPHGQQRYMHSQQQPKQPKKQPGLQLFSMKSSPNLAHSDREERREFEPGGLREAKAPPSSLYNVGTSRSSPNIQADVNNLEASVNSHYKHTERQQYHQTQNQRSPDYINITNSTPDLLHLRGTGRYDIMYPSDNVAPLSPSSGQSVPSPSGQVPLPSSHGLHRYQADYENLSHLSTQPLRSEKISEISDIDEITGPDSLAISPDPQRYPSQYNSTSDKSLKTPHPLGKIKAVGEDGYRGTDKFSDSELGGSAPLGGPPTRDPMTLKFIKVNQSHEKYPSWPVTQPSSGTPSGDQSASINSRAQSLTDHTNTSKEFPKKQRLAYTPGLRPLAERNSPTSGADDNGKTSRNASDPGFKKTEFVYDRMGRVQMRGHDAVDQRFEDFYKNSQPGYPPPSMDSDGHIIGDKEYSAPSPPERDAKGISDRELSHHLAGHMSRPGHARSPERAAAVPPNLNLASLENDSPRQGVTTMDSGNSPMENVSPLAAESRLSHEEPLPSRPISHSQSERFRPSQVQYREGSMQPNIQRDRPSSYTASLSGRESGHKPSGVNNKGVIVRSTPYYNTSTQTDMMPYAIKVSDPVAVASRLRNAQVQVNEFSPQISPKSPHQKHQFEEKSIQARMSRDFQDTNALDREINDQRKRWLSSGLETGVASPKQDRKQQDSNTSSSGNYFNYPPITSAPNASFLLLSQQSSPFPGIKSIQAKYATDDVPNTEDRNNPNSNNNTTTTTFGAADDHGAIRSAFSDNSASILRKLSEEFYGNRLGGDKQQRISSNSTATHSSTSSTSIGLEQQLHSPRLESAVQQPGLREAESYSSVVIHPDQTSGLFGRDDFGGSVSSVSGDSLRHDSSNYSDLSMGSAGGRHHMQQITQDAVGTSRSRRSLDPSYFSQKSRLQNQDSRVSSSTASLAGPRNHVFHHQRELSAPALSLSQSTQNVSKLPGPTPGANKGRPHDLSIYSDSSVVSNPKSSSSEARSSHSTSFSSHATSPTATHHGAPCFSEEPQSSAPSNMRPFSASSAVVKQDDESLNRLSSRRGSDSVFALEDDLSDDYQFNRKPSMRKAYGIYDETERLISMISKPSEKAKSKPSKAGDGSSGLPTDTPVSAPAFSSRSQRFSDGLGLIREEGGDASTDNKQGMSNGAGSTTTGDRSAGRIKENIPKYAWQNEAWLRSRVGPPKGSNLKRTTSEQISMPKSGSGENSSIGHGSARSSVSKLTTGMDSEQHTHGPLDGNTFNTYENSRLFAKPAGSGSFHGRTHSEDLTNPGREAELKRLQQQAVWSFVQRKTTASTPSPSDPTRPFSSKAGNSSSSAHAHPSLSSLSHSPESSLYESIGGKSSGGGSPTESVAEIISKANENLAKSAQRVDSIRRSNSTTKAYSGSGYPSEYWDMTSRPDRGRKETDWSRLRNSGPLRLSPESSSTDPRRSNRSSFASENPYEDISMFAPSTPRGSMSESVPDSGFSGGASMDSGVATSGGSGSQATYQNLPPAKRRPPPPLPQGGRDPSPDGPPPALPPRRYREPSETPHASGSPNNNISNNSSNKLGESLGFDPSLDNPVNSTANSSSSSTSPRDSGGTTTAADKHSRISVIPLARQPHHLQQDGGEGTEVAKRDFKSLMSQWENSSPREDRYAAELRKQAHKFSHSQQPQQQQQQQQQQQPNAMPSVLKHSRTPINISTAYKREPTLPQEATSPAATSSSSSSLSESTPVSSTSSVTHPQLQQQQQQQQQQHIPPSSSSPSSSSAAAPPPSSSSSSSPSTTASRSGATATNRSEQLLLSSPGDNHSKEAVSSPPPPQLPERTFGLQQQQQQHEAGRFRSSSDASPTPSSASSGGAASSGAHPSSGRYSNNTSATAAPVSPSGSRDRSASDHDILSDRRGGGQSSNNQSFSPSGSPHHNRPTAEGWPHDTGGSQWRSRHPPDVPPPPQQLQGSQLLENAMSADFPPPPPEALQGSEKEFAEDSYIGYKNRSSRPIGSYQRSKSAAVLPTSGATSNSSSNSTSTSNISSVGAGPSGYLHTRSVSTADNAGLGADAAKGADGVDESHGVFPSSRLAHQQAWTSEIVLSSASAAPAQAVGAVNPSNQGRVRGELSPPSSQSSPSGGVPQHPPPPVRAPRSSAHHPRFDGGGGGGSGGFGDQPAPAAVPFSSSASTTTNSGDTALPSAFSSSPANHHESSGNVPRRHPPPLPNSPPYDGQKQATAGAPATSDDSVFPGQSQFWPTSSSAASQHWREYPGSFKNRQWISQDAAPYRSPATTSASTSSHANTANSATTSPPHSPGEVVSPGLPLPPRDYRRRESAPARPVNASLSAAVGANSDRLQSPHDSPDRRQSESIAPPTGSSSTRSASTSSSQDPQALSLHPASLSPSHSRQPSQEELECDQKALKLAQHLAGQGADHQKLSEVLRSDANKKRMQFMDGLFSQSQTSLNAPPESFDGPLPSSNKTSPSSTSNPPGGGGVPPGPPQASTANGSATPTRVPAQNGSATFGINTDHSQRAPLPKEYWMSPSKAVLEMEWRKNEGLGRDLTRDINDSGSLVRQKEELLEKLHKKLEVLKEGKLSLQQEIANNDLLGTQVRLQVEARCQSRAERDKFTSFLDDLEKIVRLLLNLSGQLARAENAVQALSPEVDGKLRKLTLDKRERLYAKHEEAKLLKDDLDKRGEQVTAMLKERLLPAQLEDYVHFVRTRSQLTIELQEMEDKITLGGEQIQALRKSIPESTEVEAHHETPRSDISDQAPS